MPWWHNTWWVFVPPHTQSARDAFCTLRSCWNIHSRSLGSKRLIYLKSFGYSEQFPWLSPPAPPTHALNTCGLPLMCPLKVLLALLCCHSARCITQRYINYSLGWILCDLWSLLRRLLHRGKTKEKWGKWESASCRALHLCLWELLQF